MVLHGTDPHSWRRVLRRVRIGSSAKLVGYALADYADSASGRNVRPGMQRLVNVTELSKSSVVRALIKLRELGLVERVFEGSSAGRKGLADEYRLTVPEGLLEAVPMLDPFEEMVADAGSGFTMTPDPVDNPVDNHNLPTGNQVSADPEQVSPGRGTGVTVTPHLSTHLTSTSPNHTHAGSQDHGAELEGARATPADPAGKPDENSAINGTEITASEIDCPNCKTLLDPDGSCFVCRTAPRKGMYA